MSSLDDSMSIRYQEAISTLNSLQSNESIIKSPNSSGKTPRDILRYLTSLNIQPEQVDGLNIIHVAGTKGKGSTCAFTESILRQYGYRTGFYSSPHLVEVRERIRIDGELISKEKFIHYFWKCYHGISAATQQSPVEDPLKMPFYFAFLTTMMFYVFIHENIEVAIIEVGIGGEHDCTNMIKNPVVCGISSLGLDHVKILGDTIDKIAWQKAGIFKKGRPAVTVPQLPEAMRVLYERAEEKQCSLMIAPSLDQYPNYPFRLSLAGAVQEINASLAIQLVFHWLQARTDQSYVQLMNTPLSKEVIQGLATASWSGRNQILQTNRATYFIDGAHTVESIEQCTDWFLRTSTNQEKTTENILVFYCTRDRQPELLLRPLLRCHFEHVIFCSPMNYPTSLTNSKTQSDQWRATADSSAELERLQECVTIFRGLTDAERENKLSNVDSNIHCFETVSEAMEWIDQNKFNNKPSILVTGSLYLVGAVLKVLQTAGETVPQ